MEIEKELREYKEKKARLAILDAEIRKIQFTEMPEEFIEGEVLHAVNLSYIKRERSAGGSTERVALKLNKLNPETLAYLKPLQMEALELSIELEKVDIALGGLYERERFIVEKFYIDSLTWKNICAEYDKRFDMPLSKNGAMKLRQVAFARLKRILK